MDFEKRVEKRFIDNPKEFENEMDEDTADKILAHTSIFIKNKILKLVKKREDLVKVIDNQIAEVSSYTEGIRQLVELLEIEV